MANKKQLANIAGIGLLVWLFGITLAICCNKCIVYGICICACGLIMFATGYWLALKKKEDEK